MRGFCRASLGGLVAVMAAALTAVPASGVRVRVRLPRLLKHLRGGRRSEGSRMVTFTLGRVAPGKGRSRALSARVKPGGASG